jgi:ATP-dependent DNA helicase RecQ
MITPLREFQALVLSRPSGNSEMDVDDRLYHRLQSALQHLETQPAEVGSSDIASLVRQAMLRCRFALNEEAELRVPKERGWPDEGEWGSFGCDARIAGKHHFLLQARAWVPSWLDKNAASVIEASIGEVERRQNRFVPSDPLVSEYTGLREYVTPGQRAAVQAAFLMPPGCTVIINLPTGGGKTLAFQLPALAWADQGGLCVVVVPTVALAKDQEARFLTLLKRKQKSNSQAPRCLAYHSELDDELKKSVRDGIRNGGLPILFASPEAIMGTLRGPLFEAAEQGRLRLFAVDEAHVVAQWGQQFRPEFQSIAGLKDALLDACPANAKFRTLLLTATLTEESYDALNLLFGRGGCELVSEAALRLEPGFLLESAIDEADRTRHIVEAIRFLPRPLILYTTLRDHAMRFYQELLTQRFRRVRLVRGGDISDSSGDQVLKDWRSGVVDIVVATSAFGLGMDQAEVRSVVHACLPETIDRYYQEVGRSGRDGKASTSLLVSTVSDVSIAEGLSRERLISVDRGFERWEAMWLRRKKADNDAYVISLDDRPTDIADVSSRNISWNLRTLVLMARVGLIEFAPHPPPIVERRDEETLPEFEKRRSDRFEEFTREVGLKIRDPRHSDKAHWDEAVTGIRNTLRAGDEREATLVRELRDLRRPLNDIFREVYTLIEPPVLPPRLAGSCPVTRELGTVSFQMADPEVTSINRSNACLSAELERALLPCSDEVGRSWISTELIPSDSRELRHWREKILSLLRYAISGGVVELSIPDDVLSEKDWSQLTMRSTHRFLIRDSATRGTRSGHRPVSRLTLVVGNLSNTLSLEQAMMLHRPRHIILVSHDLSDPRAPHRRLLDVVRHLSIEDVLARLQS